MEAPDDDYDENDDPQEEEDELVDDDEIEEEEEDEDEAVEAAVQQLGLGGFAAARAAAAARQQAAAAAAAAVTDWAGLKSFPAGTQASLMQILTGLRGQNVNEITILLLGKSGMGKSSTANSLFGERVAQVSAFQADTTKPTMVGRRVTVGASEFTLSVIDTPGLLDGDYVNQRALNSIAKFIDGKPIHAVMYVDRLDLWRVDKADKAAFEAVSATLGSSIWGHALLALTHGQMPSPDGMPYQEFTQRRMEQLRAGIWEAGVPKGQPQPALPGVLVENSGRCSSNDGGEKVLPNGAVWLTEVVSQVARLAQGGALWVFQASEAQVSDPNKKNRWHAVPLLLFQVFVLRPLLIRQMRRDGEPGSAD